MEQFVETEVRQKVVGMAVLISSTGTTINFGTCKIQYVKTTAYQKLHNINEKRLERYRDKVKNQIKLEDQMRYYVYMDGMYWYTPKMLEFIKYKRYRNVKPESAVSKQIKNGNETHRSGIINWMKPKKWQYKCGISYPDAMTFDACTDKMKRLFNILEGWYPAAKILIFYVTEENPGRDGHHNHFLVSITGKGLKNKKRNVMDAINTIGSSRYECKKYQPEQGEDFLRYITKHLERNPESYWYLTNEDQRTIEASLSPSDVFEIHDEGELEKAA